MEEKRARILELVEQLNHAAAVYYQGRDEVMSNYEYDKQYDELQALEKETGIVLAGSPTQRVGYEVLSELPKEQHPSPMLSLDKTKDTEQLAAWLGEHPGLLSWKMDGLTIVLTYQEGTLQKAVTRGNGQVGEVITGNARMFDNVPLQIPFQGELVLRGEAVITYSRFREINESLPVEEQYKNPRNLCSGSVRQLDSRVTKSRHVNFFAFSLVTAEGVDFEDSQENKFKFLQEQGFTVVEYVRVTGETLPAAVAEFAEKIVTNDFPSDGLVLLMDEIAYGESLGRTAKFPRNAMAFKWADEIAETVLEKVEWSASRTGLINPVAVFEPVELEGTTVSRASVHNVSIVEQLALGVGDHIQVYKANMIIPQIAENLTRSGVRDIPETCPACGGATRIQMMNNVETLYCTNPECPAKFMKAFTLFVSRDAMNIDGMSEATLEKFVGHGFIREFADIFRLDRYRDEIVEMDGFGEKSYQNLIDSIERAKNTTLPRLIFGLGILNIGLANARMICKAFDFDLDRIRNASAEDFAQIDGVGEVIAKSIVDYFADEENKERLERLLSYLTIEKPQASQEEQKLAGLTFVITGSVEHFPNRNALKARIEELGGKATGSVTGKTSYLINNDTTSSSSKNRKARELGVPVISEEEFLKMTEE